MEAHREREEAEAQRKRKAQMDRGWENTREERVQGWRSFQKVSKKKKKASNVLG